MEALIDAGFFQGVLDITTTEWCDELIGGVLAAGSHRCEAAGRNKIPQVVSVGAMDMVNFGPIDTVPEKFLSRNLYRHNPTVTLMRTTVSENIRIGNKLAEKLNMAKGKTILMLPLGGVSEIDKPGQPFYGKEEDEALFQTLRKETDANVVRIEEMNQNINDPIFGETAAKKLIELMEAESK